MSQKREYNNEYKKMRSDVLKRDKHKCQMPGCKYRGRKLEVHHISRYCDMPSSKYDPLNCLTLCKFHHKEVTGKETLYAQLFRQIILNKLKEK